MKTRKGRPNRGSYRKVAKKWHFKKCVCCGITQALTIHHIDGNPYNHKLSNLCYLCVDCHRDVDQKGDGAKVLQIKSYIKFFKARVMKAGKVYIPFNF